jgi:hypothetical protein
MHLSPSIVRRRKKDTAYSRLCSAGRARPRTGAPRPLHERLAGAAGLQEADEEVKLGIGLGVREVVDRWPADEQPDLT